LKVPNFTIDLQFSRLATQGLYNRKVEYQQMKTTLLLLSMAVCASTFRVAAQETADGQISPLSPGVTKIPVVFSGGHETDPRDHGRPVVLIASALGVSSNVFREAFSQVHPADPIVGPTGDEARKNKSALLAAWRSMALPTSASTRFRITIVI